ncbi:hypothetical protein SDC9_05204 [bioreactor metagenome]|uniref:Uncharacterized protein n=1 Tax=bioreactor metagenome TaxID=1076179 RepID=A0A644SYC6_9ZZZZ
MKARTVETPATARGPVNIWFIGRSLSLYGYHAGEADERHGHEAYGDEGYARAFETRGNGVVLVQLRPYRGQKHDRQPPAGAGPEAEDHGLKEVVVADLEKEYDAQDGAVDRDQGKENAKSHVKGWGKAVDDHLQHLHHAGYDNDENDEGEVFDGQGTDEEIEYRPADGRANADDHGDGEA